MKICITGAGISGLTTARILAENSYSVDIFEKENQIGGNLLEHTIDGTLVHLHGPHIFHTNSEEIWKFVNRFTKFAPYFHHVRGFVMGKSVPIPFNFESIEILFGVEKAKFFREKLINLYGFGQNINIAKMLDAEDIDIKFLGKFIFQNIFKGYSEKQWGIPIEDINPTVLARVPVNLSYDSRYFTDKYQGIPENGYLNMLKNIANHKNINLMLNKNISKKDIYDKYDYIFLSSPIDEFFDFEHGELSYRSLKFKKISPELNLDRHENTITNNFPNEFDFTRITKYGLIKKQTNQPIYIAEYPEEFKLGKNHRYYPIVNELTSELNSRYQEQAKKMNIIPIGRLGRYQYLNMDQAVGSALSKVKEFLKKNLNKLIVN
jgi:UDP-galactopyranose mutase